MWTNLYEWLVTCVGAFLFLFSGLLMSLLCLCVLPFVTQHQAHFIGRRGMHYMCRLYFTSLGWTGLFHTDLSDLDQLRDSHRLIIAPNHPCLMDALFVVSRLTNVVCVMKASIIKNPILFGCAKLGGFIRSDSPTRFVQECEQVLQEGAQLLLFPEGTRTVTDSVNTFKGGFALIAQKTQTPVQTVLISANTDFLGKRWPIWKKPHFPLRYRCILGDSFRVEKEQDHRKFTASLETYFKNALVKDQGKR